MWRYQITSDEAVSMTNGILQRTLFTVMFLSTTRVAFAQPTPVGTLTTSPREVALSTCFPVQSKNPATLARVVAIFQPSSGIVSRLDLDFFESYAVVTYRSLTRPLTPAYRPDRSPL